MTESEADLIGEREHLTSDAFARALAGFKPPKRHPNEVTSDRIGAAMDKYHDHIRQLTREFRERDAAAQHLIGLLRYHLGDHEAAGKDYRPYRDWKALDPGAPMLVERAGVLLTDAMTPVERAIAIVESSRQTHLDWAGWLAEHPLEHESIGDAAWHTECVQNYDEVLALLAHLQDAQSGRNDHHAA